MPLELVGLQSPRPSKKKVALRQKGRMYLQHKHQYHWRAQAAQTQETLKVNPSG